MLKSSEERILGLLDDGDVVLEVGGWADPFPRADWVLDLLPYETRGLYGDPARLDSERLSAERWVVRDACEREPFPFDDDQFEFVVCSHTLEDIRDPVWVCSELVRVGRAGYIEVPSRAEEQTRGIHGPWVGWSHHRWLCDVSERGISFVHKPGVLHGRAEFEYPHPLYQQLSPESRVQPLFWERDFDFSERIFLEPTELDAYLSEVVPGDASASRRPRLLGRLARRSKRRWRSNES